MENIEITSICFWSKPKKYLDFYLYKYFIGGVKFKGFFAKLSEGRAIKYVFTTTYSIVEQDSLQNSFVPWSTMVRFLRDTLENNFGTFL